MDTLKKIINRSEIQIMTEAQATRNSKIKTFQQKTLNRSFTDMLFYDKLADYLLDCCNSNAKPNTLSFYSFLPLFILAFIVQGPTTFTFLATIFGILLHQLFDIANKKQAYRLSSFSLSTFYVDHLFDSLSVTFMVYIISCLLELSASSILTAVFFFGILPFYVHHLVMYNNQYLTFPLLSPPTEGLMITKILFFVAAFYPQLFSAQIFETGIYFYQIYIAASVIWLIIFLLLDFKSIISGKRITDIKSGLQEEYPLKNIFSIFMIGYLTMQTTSIQPQLLSHSLYFYLCFGLISLLNSHLITNLILAYGFNQRYKQITLPFLIVCGVVLIYYFSCAFLLEGQEVQFIISKVILGITFVGFLLYFIRDSWSNILYINSVITP